jgi:hypothetical protein
VTGAAGWGLRTPPCGNSFEAHPRHRFARWSSDTGESGSCDGWGQAEADASVMTRAVRDAMAENEASSPVPGRTPPLRLEVHPQARYGLLRIMVPSSAGPADSLFGVPIVLTDDLPAGGWQVIRPGPALAEGTVRNG